MQFRKLHATFGKLDHFSIALAPGLNLIEAPNESGKSTLCAFLRTMLYGFPSGRGVPANEKKDFYVPWSNAAMQGSLELAETPFGDVTILRDTARSNAPFGRVRVVYTGTDEVVAELQGADCGEKLLGIPREVYERSGFLSQGGARIGSDHELERRINALVTTGEEAVSYSDIQKKLNDWKNNRRSNSTNGRIAVLEREIAEKRQTLSDLREQMRLRDDAAEQVAALLRQEQSLRRALQLHDLADAQDAARALREAEDAAQEARFRADTLRSHFTASGIPPRETLEAAQVRLDGIRETMQTLQAANAERDAAADALAAHEQNAPTPGKRTSPLLYVLFALLAVLAAVVFPFAIPLPLAAAGFCAIRDGKTKTTDRQTEDAFRTQSDTLRDALRERDDVCRSLQLTLDTQKTALQQQIARSEPDEAERYLREKLDAYAELAALEEAARQAQFRAEARRTAPVPQAPVEPVERPAQSRASLESALAAAVAERSDLQSAADRADGVIRTMSESVSEAEIAQKEEEVAFLYEERDAILLAMDVLEEANTALQNRFSPELGRRTSERFAALTGDKWQAVTLNRSFDAAAQSGSDPIARDSHSLSRGTQDQLYLAVRLAICDLVLPAERNIPLVLDDALINFDDARCRAALALLAKEAEQRQILLFTCQGREKALLEGQKSVTFLTL